MPGSPLERDGEPETAGARLAAEYVVVAVIAVVAVVGTLRGDGFWSPWLLTGLALVPVLQWLTRGDR